MAGSQRQDADVAMTEQGINDSLALKKVHSVIAIACSDAAKNARHTILLMTMTSLHL